MTGAPLARSITTLSRIGDKPQEALAKVRTVFSVRSVTLPRACRWRSRNDAQRIWNRQEPNALMLAHVLPVDLKGDRPGGPESQLSHVMQGQNAVSAWRAALGRKHPAQNAERAYGPQAAEREDIEAGAEARLRIGVNGAVAKVCPWRCVRDDAKE